MDFSLITDEELVALCIENDEAFAVLAERYMEIAKLSALKFKNTSIETDDLTQEAMFGFLSAVYSFKNDGNCSFKTYATHCIKNRILSVLRATCSKKRIPLDMLVPFEQQEHLNDVSPSPEESLISEKSAEDISALISGSLSKQEHQVFMLYLTGMKYDDISATAGISVKAVDSTLQRARKKLREKLSFYK